MNKFLAHNQKFLMKLPFKTKINKIFSLKMKNKKMKYINIWMILRKEELTILKSMEFYMLLIHRDLNYSKSVFQELLKFQNC
jgi:hypothetical protein